MELEGEIRSYLGVLGAHPDDPALSAVLDLPGPTSDTNETREADGNVVFHLAARSGGTEFLFSHEQLVAVFLGTRAREAWGAYPRPDALITGLAGDASRAEVRSRFGEPVWSSDSSDRFEVDGKFVQFVYRDDRIEVIVVAVGGTETDAVPHPAADPQAEPTTPLATDSSDSPPRARDGSPLPADLQLWRARQRDGESTPWDRFGVRFLDDGEQPAVLDTPSSADEEPADPRTIANAEATRLTAELVTWVAEDYEGDEGRWWGYWRGPEDVRPDGAMIVTLESGDWFDPVRGRSISEALCVDFSASQDEFAEFAEACRAAGAPIEAHARDDVPFWDPEQNPRRYREARFQELIAQAAPRGSTEHAPPAQVSEAPPVITGRLRTVIAAFGRPFEDPAVQAARSLLGPPFTRSEYRIGPEERVYESAVDGHAELIFTDGVFTTAMIWIRDHEERKAYAEPGSLIEGVGPETTRDAIRVRFGEPQWSNDTADRFGIDGVFVRFEYVDGRLTEITAMLTVPA